MQKAKRKVKIQIQIHLHHAKGHIVFEGQVAMHPHIPEGSQHKCRRINGAQRKDEHAQQGGQPVVPSLKVGSLAFRLLLCQLSYALNERRYLHTTRPHAGHFEERGQTAGERTKGIHGIHGTGVYVAPAKAELRLAAMQQIHKIKDEPACGPNAGQALEVQTKQTK